MSQTQLGDYELGLGDALKIGDYRPRLQLGYAHTFGGRRAGS